MIPLIWRRIDKGCCYVTFSDKLINWTTALSFIHTDPEVHFVALTQG